MENARDKDMETATAICRNGEGAIKGELFRLMTENRALNSRIDRLNEIIEEEE